MAYEKIMYNNEFNKKNYDVVRALVPKGKGAAVKACAKERGMSVSALIVEALETCYALDLSKND